MAQSLPPRLSTNPGTLIEKELDLSVLDYWWLKMSKYSKKKKKNAQETFLIIINVK